MLHATSQLDAVWWNDLMLTRYSQDILRLLSQRVAVSVTRDTTSVVTVQGQATYAAPPDFLDTIHIYFKGLPLRPASTQQIERLDSMGFQTTQGTPLWWYMDKIGENRIGLYPVPDANSAGTALEIIFHSFLACTLTPTSVLNAPIAIQDFLCAALLARAYNDENDSRMLDVANGASKIAQIIHELAENYYGKAQ